MTGKSTGADRPTVLVVEDDRGVRESLAMVLDYQGIEVVQAETGEEGLDLVAELDPDAVVLDVNLPGIDGLEVCRRLRDRGDDRPVLMLTARHEVGDRVAGLDAGADDYLPKPFALEELLARVRAMLRRSASGERGTGSDGGNRSGDGDTPGSGAGLGARTGSGQISNNDELVLDSLHVELAARRARRGDTALELTKLEFDLLELLLRNADVVLARDTIHERIWGYGEDLSSNTLEVLVSGLRKKTEVGGASRLIQTVRGVGYVARLP